MPGLTSINVALFNVKQLYLWMLLGIQIINLVTMARSLVRRSYGTQNS